MHRLIICPSIWVGFVVLYACAAQDLATSIEQSSFVFNVSVSGYKIDIRGMCASLFLWYLLSDLCGESDSTILWIFVAVWSIFGVSGIGFCGRMIYWGLIEMRGLDGSVVDAVIFWKGDLVGGNGWCHNYASLDNVGMPSIEMEFGVIRAM